MGLWQQVRKTAAETPDDRNRFVDFLRAVSIAVVIFGHWLIATAWYTNGELEIGHLLKSHPRVQWLTWVFQVMPIFFIVGGYANAVSLESARRRSVSYAGWLTGRLNRLITPLLLLVVCWALIGITMGILGARPEVIQYASQASLIPTWFLAIYIVVVILAPWTYRLWRSFGYWSVAGCVVLATLVDWLFFDAGLQWLGWSNYFWVWLGVHQLGFAWRDGRTGSAGAMFAMAVAGIAALALLIFNGPYPLAMVGSPDEGLSNTLPPKLTLMALAIFQFGLLLALEKPARRMLAGEKPWAITVLVNTMIMTVYLWHITIMIVLVGILELVGGVGLGLEPGTPQWWVSRPLWILVLVALLIPVALPLSSFERRARAADRAPPAAARQIGGALLLCLGIALLALYGYGGGPLPGLDVAAFAMVVAGAAISGLLPSIRIGRRP